MEGTPRSEDSPQGRDVGQALGAVALRENIEALMQLARDVEGAEAALLAQVERSREAGVSWRQIGQARGITPQAAQQWYQRRAAQTMTPEQESDVQ